MSEPSMSEAVERAVKTYVDVMRSLNISVDFEPKIGTVKVPFAGEVPASVIKAMAVILRERIVGREVLFEGFVGGVYVKTKARIRDVAYEDEEPITGARMRGFIITLESAEEHPRLFEVCMALDGMTSIINMLNSALLIHNNAWLGEEVVSAAREASKRLSESFDVLIRAYAALKLLGADTQ